jgi:hypothetical protein
MYNPSLPMSSTNHPDIIASPNLVVSPVTGILAPETKVISPVTPDLSPQPVIVNVITPAIRPSGITDQQWSEMQTQGAVKITNQAAQVNENMQAKQIADAIATSEKAAAAYSGTDAIASASHAADLAAVIKSGVPSGAATEIASQIMRAADAAAQAAALPDATQDDKTAATVANIIATQALADASKIKQDELQSISTEAEQTVAALKAKADASSTAADLIAANQAQARLDEANKSLMNSQQLTDDAVHQAAMTKQQADSDAAAIAAALLMPKVTASVAVKKNIFDRLIDYIYEKLYANH